MRLLEVKNDIVKILYTPSERQLLLADFLLLKDFNQNLICQITGIESAQEDNCNIAEVKLLLNVNENSELTLYNGYIPSKNACVDYIDQKKIVSLLRSSKTNLYWGKLSSHSDAPVYLGLNFLREKAYITCDNIDNVKKINSNIIYNLQYNKKRTVVFDTEGCFVQIAPSCVLTFGKNFKIPLNAQAFEFIASSDLSECSLESRAFIQGIFIELEEYAQSLEEKFIPFSIFKKVIDEQARNNPVSELMILRNKILRYEHSGIFAETSEQFKIYRENLAKSTTTTIDVSKIDEKYQKLVLNFLASQTDKKCYLIFNATDTNVDRNTLSLIYDNSGIRPVPTFSYDFKYADYIKSQCPNKVLFKPLRGKIEEEEEYSRFFPKLRKNEFIIYGDNTFYLPLIIKLETADKSVLDKLSEDAVEKADALKLFEQLQVSVEDLPKPELSEIISQETALSDGNLGYSKQLSVDSSLDNNILQIPEQDAGQETELFSAQISQDTYDIEIPADIIEIKDELQIGDIAEKQAAQEIPEIKFESDDELQIKDELQIGDIAEKQAAPEIPEIKFEADDNLVADGVPKEVEIVEKNEDIDKTENDTVFDDVPDEMKDIFQAREVTTDSDNQVEYDTEFSSSNKDIEPETDVNDDNIVNEDLDFLDEYEANEEEIIEKEQSIQDDTIFESYVEESSSNTTKIDDISNSFVKEDNSEKKQIFQVSKQALNARQDLMDILEIDDNQTKAVSFVQKEQNIYYPDNLFGQSVSMETDSEKTDEEEDKVTDIESISEPESEFIVEEQKESDEATELVEEEDLEYLDEMLNSMQPPNKSEEFSQSSDIENYENSQEITDSELKEIEDDKDVVIEEVPLEVDTESRENSQEITDTELKEIESDKDIVIEEVPLEKDNESNDDNPILIIDEQKTMSEDTTDLVVSSRILTDEKLITIDKTQNSLESVNISQKDPEIVIDNLSTSTNPISIDMTNINNTVELISGVGSFGNDTEVEQILPEEFADLTDDDIAVLEINDADKDIDIKELNRISDVDETVDTSALLEDFIEVPEGYKEDNEPILTENKDERNETENISAEIEKIDIENLEEEITKDENPESESPEIADFSEEDKVGTELTNTVSDIEPSLETEDLPVLQEENEEENPQEVQLISPDIMLEPVMETEYENPETPVIQDVEPSEADNNDDTISESGSDDEQYSDFNADDGAKIDEDKISITSDKIQEVELPEPAISQERRRTVEQSRQVLPVKPPEVSISETRQEIPVYEVPVEQNQNNESINYGVGDWVVHPKYGKGQVESFARYSNKILFCTILFENFGRRTLDAKLTGIEKIK